MALIERLIQVDHILQDIEIYIKAMALEVQEAVALLMLEVPVQDQYIHLLRRIQETQGIQQLDLL